MSPWLGRALAHLTAGDHRGLAHQVPLLAILGATGLGFRHLGIQRQYAAMLREDRFAAAERPILDVGDFQDGPRCRLIPLTLAGSSTPGN